MASQQGPPPARPWFRLASMARPAPAPAPAPTPAPPPAQEPPMAQPQAQPRPPLLRPTFTFRPPTTPQPPSPVASPPPPPPVAPAPPPPPAAAAPPPPPASTTSSVPTSPVIRTFAASSSVPTSPTPAAPRPSPTSTVLPVTSSSVPQSPQTTVSGPSSSLPSSQAPPPAPSSPLPATTATTDRIATPKSSPKIVKTLEKTPPPSPKIVPSGPSYSLRTFAAPPPPSSPAHATPANNIITARSEPPKSSPKIARNLEKSPNPSPKIKPISHPPSPLTLPPAQIKTYPEPETKIPAETEKKTVLVQETIGKPTNHTPSIAQNGKPEATKNGEIKQVSDHKKSSKSDEFGTSVITIAGENRGAVMEFSPSSRKTGGNPRQIHKKSGSSVAWSDDDGDERSGSEYDEEGRLKMKNKNGGTSLKSNWTKYMNSNVQGVNNSILFNSSSTHHDPGVHVSLSRKIHGSNGHETHRNE